MRSIYVFMIIMGTLSCSSNLIQDETFENNLQLACTQADEGESIDMARLTNFSWDKFFVFTPYTAVDNMESRLGFSDIRLPKTDITFRDDMNLLVFVEDHKIIHYVEYARIKGDFDKTVNKKDGFSPAEAVFKVHFRAGWETPILVWPAD